MQATTSNKVEERASMTPECALKPLASSDNAQTIPQVNAHAEHVKLLLSTIERLSEHLDLDGQLSALQHARAALIEEAQTRAQTQLSSKTSDELSGFQQQVYSLTGENSEMKLELLRWRKKTAVLKLKLSSSEESCRHLMDNQAANKEAMQDLVERNQALSTNNQDLSHQLASALKSLSDLEASFDNQKSRLSSSESSIADLDSKLRSLSTDHEQASRHIASLEKDLSSLVARNEAIERSHDLAVTAQKLAEEKAAMAEAALSSWKQFDVDRKRLLKEREDQLKDLAEERSKLSSDRAHIAKGKAQAQIAILQSQLDNEIGVRHQSELSLKQQLAASRERCDVERRRADHLEQQLLSMERRVAELSIASQHHQQMPTVVIKKAGGIKSQLSRQPEVSVSADDVDRAVESIIDQLIPVIEDEEGEDAVMREKMELLVDKPKKKNSLKVVQATQPTLPETETVAAAFATASEKVKVKKKAKESEQKGEKLKVQVAAEKPARAKKVSKSLREDSEDDEDEQEDELLLPKASKAPRAEPKAKRQRKTALVPIVPEPKASRSQDPFPKQQQGPEPNALRSQDPFPKQQQGPDFDLLHEELDEGGHTIPDSYDEVDHDEVEKENHWPVSQPNPGANLKGAPAPAPAQGYWSQQEPILPQRAQLSDVMAAFRSRSTLNPLAALNSRVLEAAAARRGRVSLGGNRRISLGGGNAIAAKKRRTSLKPNAAPLGGGGSDVVPASMLFDSLLKVPKIK